ncbi:MAG: tagaturonate reductase [Longimicrobiaceae bacterium]
MTLPTLARALLPSLRGREDLVVPAPEVLDLPEKVVQFGTGALLRGLIEPAIDEANERGELGGRIVMVGQTGSGRDRAINRQDGLYTLVTRGLVDGEPRTQRRVISSVSRALSAAEEWDAVLALARQPELRMVFSNTTEAGLALDERDQLEDAPPRSFPGKLTRFLWERARAFDFSDASYLFVFPTELVEENGEVLRERVRTQALRWKLGAHFLEMVEETSFHGTLVDRIVPGTPAPDEHAHEEATLGYRDALLTVAEPYSLFVIEGDTGAALSLPFQNIPGNGVDVRVLGDAAPFRERKLRLLNGTHTAMVPVALLAGCETVRDAMEDAQVGRFIRRIALDEIAPFVEAPDAAAFAREVLDRFANPFIRHAVSDIVLQQTMKLRVRVVPSILDYARQTGHVPASLAFAFAAWLRFARGDLQRAREAAGRPLPRDDQGGRVRALWKEVGNDVITLARRACADTGLWDADLSAVPGFADAVASSLARVMEVGARAALGEHLARVEAQASTMAGSGG